MSGRFAKEVASTKNVFFDEDFKTFRLYAGNSMYCFCITPDLSLEHLYWGKRLPPGYDLRYLSQSIRNAPFNTVDAEPDRLGGRIVIGAETLEEVMNTYKESKTASADAASALQKRRLENYSWRILNKASQLQVNHGKKAVSFEEDREQLLASLGSPLTKPRASFSSTEKKKDESGRQRSSTNPSSPTSRGRRPSLDGLDLVHAETYDMHHPLRGIKIPSFLAEKTFTGHKQRMLHHQHVQAFERAVGKMGKGLLCCEYSDHGTGDFRTPSFMVVDNSNGSSISPLRYKSHAIYRGKLPMPDAMPSIRCLSEREASTLVVTMADINTGLEVDLIYGKNTCRRLIYLLYSIIILFLTPVAMHDYDAVTRRAVFRNVDTRSRTHYGPPGDDAGSSDHCGHCSCTPSKEKGNSKSMTIDFEATNAPFHLVNLTGRFDVSDLLVSSCSF